MVRRHLNKGQIAIVVAKAYPEAKQGGDHTTSAGKKATLKIKVAFPMVSEFALSQARTIVRYAPELVDRVLGLKGMGFSEGYAREARDSELMDHAARELGGGGQQPVRFGGPRKTGSTH